jgi:hypothetical protein
VARALFDTESTGIVKGIEEIVGFLSQGADEYADRHGDVDRNAKLGKSLSYTADQHDMRWLKAFTSPYPFMPAEYREALLRSKQKMRDVTFAPSGGKGR